MIDISAQVDATAFNAAWKEAMEVSKRTLPEFTLGHAYFFSRNAVGETKASDNGKIESDLMKGSNLNSKAPVAAILINKQRGLTGQLGLQGGRMLSEVKKFIRKRKSVKNFLRAGWLPAVKKLGALVKSKKGQAKIPSGVKIKGQEKGGATPPNNNTWNPVCEVWNSVQGGKSPSPEVEKEIIKGAQGALNKEALSMHEHAKDVLNKGFSKFNAS